MKLDDSNSIISTIVLADVWLHSCDTARDHRLDSRILTEEPELEDEVVNGAIDEDSA